MSTDDRSYISGIKSYWCTAYVLYYLNLFDNIIYKMARNVRSEIWSHE